ncbi:MAG: YrhB domain-containing protein [Stappiaceae bacterium]
MITYDQARKIADAHVAEKEAWFFSELENPEAIDKLEIGKVFERSFGWVFMYGSNRFSVTQRAGDILMFNAPFAVDRNDGSITEFGASARPAEFYVDEFEKEWLARQQK